MSQCKIVAAQPNRAAYLWSLQEMFQCSLASCGNYRVIHQSSVKSKGKYQIDRWNNTQIIDLWNEVSSC